MLLLAAFACFVVVVVVVLLYAVLLWSASSPNEMGRSRSPLYYYYYYHYIVQRTSKAEQDQKNRVRKWRVVERIYEMKYSWKGHKDRNRHKKRIKRSGQAWLVSSQAQDSPKFLSSFWCHSCWTWSPIMKDCEPCACDFISNQHFHVAAGYSCLLCV